MGGWNGLCIGVKVPVLIIMLMVFINYLSLSCKRDKVHHGGKARAASYSMVTRTLATSLLKTSKQTNKPETVSGLAICQGREP